MPSRQQTQRNRGVSAHDNGFMSIPGDPVSVPARVSALARGAALAPVWVNNIGGLTFRTDDGRYIKFGPRNPETSFAAEAERLAWAAGFTAVPRVLEFDADATHEWLVTAAQRGQSAVAPRWVTEPATAVHAIGAGLRASTTHCPSTRAPSSGASRRASRTPQRAASTRPMSFVSRRRSICSSSATATPAPPTRSSTMTGGAVRTWISALWASATGGPTSRSPR